MVCFLSALHAFPSQIEEQKMVVQFELENLEMKLDPEPALTDLIHAVSICNRFCVSLDDSLCIFNLGGP